MNRFSPYPKAIDDGRRISFIAFAVCTVVNVVETRARVHFQSDRRGFHVAPKGIKIVNKCAAARRRPIDGWSAAQNKGKMEKNPHFEAHTTNTECGRPPHSLKLVKLMLKRFRLYATIELCYTTNDAVAKCLGVGHVAVDWPFGDQSTSAWSAGMRAGEFSRFHANTINRCAARFAILDVFSPRHCV